MDFFVSIFLLFVLNTGIVCPQIVKNQPQPAAYSQEYIECPTKEFCLHGGTCYMAVNTKFPLYYCKCKDEYSGETCQFKRSDAETCQQEVADYFCLNGGSCYVERGDDDETVYYCKCSQKFFGARCESISPTKIQLCPQDTELVCQNGGTCYESTMDDKTYEFCACTDEYIGRECVFKVVEDNSSTILNELLCLNEGACNRVLLDDVEIFGCSCQQGFYGDRCEYRSSKISSLCSDEDSNFCFNGGICYQEAFGNNKVFFCICETGFIGQRCEISSSESQMCEDLEDKFCANGGTCFQVHYMKKTLYYCECTYHFGGTRCEKKLPRESTCPSPLDTKTCENSGTCLSIDTGGEQRAYMCKCAEGYYGATCEYRWPSQPMHSVCPEEVLVFLCLNGGTCYKDTIMNRPFYYCECIKPFTGVRCEIKITKWERCPPTLDTNLCLNDGVCSQVATHTPILYFCQCKELHFGARCEFTLPGSNIEEYKCPSDMELLCKNGGKCVAVPYVIGKRSYYCSCPEGLYGMSCEYPYFALPIKDKCPSGMDKTFCLNGGTCYKEEITLHTVYMCDCVYPYSGERCERMSIQKLDCPPEFNNGAIKLCLHGGVCTSRISNGYTVYVCECTRGRFGARCEHDRPKVECPEDFKILCKHGGTCFSSFLVGTTTVLYYCDCVVGFFGILCEYPHAFIETTDASCPPEIAEKYCEHGGTCHTSRLNGDPVYYCLCPEGYHGVTCEFLYPSTKCPDEINRVLCPQGTCFQRQINGVYSYECVCNQGFYGDRCEHDESYLGLIPDSRQLLFNELCKNNGTAILIKKLYYCKCPQGFYGIVCQYPFHPGLEKHEPCQLDAAESYCLNGGKCYRTDINSQSVFFCECVAQYYGARCEYFLPSMMKCKAPFDKLLCDHGTCTVIISYGQIVYSCGCLHGYSGARCEHELKKGNPCPVSLQNKLCANGGSCVVSHFNEKHILYFCSCKDEFYGISCEYKMAISKDESCPEELAITWCLHGGTCFKEYKVNRVVYRCECTSPYYGVRCEKHFFIQLHCPPSMQETLCYNGGSCIPVTVGRDTVYYCKCISQYYGARCEYCKELVEVGGCPSHLNTDLCKNGGTCIIIKGPNEKNIFYCKCPEGLYGLSCEYPYPHLATAGRPCPACLDETYCLHGGTCYREDIMGNSVYHCQCMYPYHGERCDVIHPQQLNCPNQFNYFLCLNNGTCLQSKSNGHKIYICICQDGYYGPRCEHTCGQMKNPAELCEDPFSTELCKNGGTCVSVKFPEGNELLFCKCEAGTFGTSCEYPFLPLLHERTLCPPDISKYFCLNGGTCFQDIEPDDIFYYCSCPGTYFGERCELNIAGQRLCATSYFQPERKLCLNGGSCVQQQTHSHDIYMCLCAQGYYGPRCEYSSQTKELRSECPSPIDHVLCMNGATCTVLVTEKNEHIYFCTCAEGYYGMICEYKIPPSTLAGDYCPAVVAENWCQNGGTCYQGSVIGDTVYYCDCIEPFHGPKCEMSHSEELPCPQILDKFLCINGGVCIRRLFFKHLAMFYSCDCPLGYSGARCEKTTRIERKVRLVTGEKIFCNSRGTCLKEENGGYLHCHCNEGFFGERCSIKLDNQVQCPPEYKGHICFNGGTCWLGNTTHRSTAYCECQAGYVGQQCEFTKPGNSYCSSEINSFLCLNGGTCVIKKTIQKQELYYCECPEQNFGLRCEYNSPKSESCNMPHSCSNRGTCYSFKFSVYSVHYCVCEPGYEGSICQYPVQKHPTHYLCPPEIAEWFCDNNGTCFQGTVNNNADYYCICPEGFVGHRCQFMAQNAAQPTEEFNVCKNNGTWKEIKEALAEDFYICVCPDGYGGRRCEYVNHKIDTCPGSLEISFCLNGGICKILIFGGHIIYYCHCKEPYYGTRCEETKPVEHQDLNCPENIVQYICLNGGTCHRKLEQKLEVYFCICKNEYWGERCEYTYEHQTNCSEQLYQFYCLNGGTCYELTVGKEKLIHCECLKNFFGSRCESHIPLVGLDSERCIGEIDTYFCLNGGSCYQLVVNYEVFYFCDCPQEWGGLRCEDGPVTKEQCPYDLGNEYCLNDGICYKLQVGIQELYYCKCASGFEGTRCEYNIPSNSSLCSDAFSGMYCLNSGTCFQMTVLDETLYLCDCEEGFWGKQCEFSTFIRNFCPPMLDTSFCLNGGTCYQILVDDKDLYYCVCTNNYYGMRCENSYLESHETEPCESKISAEICLNGGSCYETSEYGPKLFYCECAEGYSGKRCEQKNMGYLHVSYLNMQHLERSSSSLQMDICFFLLMLWFTLCYKTMF